MKQVLVFLCGLSPLFLNQPVHTADEPKDSQKQEKTFETDVFPTELGDLVITFIGHGTLMMTCGGKVIHIDPWTQLADYTKLPKADLILITHEHRDHLDSKAVELLGKEGTIVVIPEKCREAVPKGLVMKNGDRKKVLDLDIEAVPAYNLIHKRPDGQPFHPKGQGNGYVITFGKTRVYIAGDTENIPEMQNLKDIAVAFLPMNLPYTMTPEMAAAATRMFRPKVLYPYHYGQTDPQELVRLLAEDKDIEVRIRRMS
ncbi:MAG TPA: MBL fold metallo-hydrolase [Anaerohalosphaeraceae bacterium]|nr:MBL fold metallo-hydrolase [Anaerohalosphaeraceae bacterium]HOL89480.1 MBL fold metallo-hydrolase [Anaerohalosphaeraceae bacterium]HPP55262.1 MBL fold metallo-hydrolase [Anaerohalosphaeraceae bacterium]